MTRPLEILLNTSAGSLEKYEIKGVKTGYSTDDQMKNVMRNRMNTAIEIAGRVFIPGLGIVTSGHSTRITLYADWFFRSVERLKQQITTRTLPQQLKTAVYAKIGVPVRLGALIASGGLCVIDKNRPRLVLLRMKCLE